MKIRPVGDELFRADGRTDMTKLIVAFRIFAKAPKNGQNKILDVDICIKLICKIICSQNTTILLVYIIFIY